MKITEFMATEKLAKQIRLMEQLRDIRNFAKHERAEAPENDRIVWEHLYTVMNESISQTEEAIAGMMPSGKYQYLRALPGS